MTIAVHDDALGAWRGAWIGELLGGAEVLACPDPAAAVRSGAAQAAVLSTQDPLPLELEPAAFCERGDIREALVAPGLGTVEHLPEGARVGGTSVLQKAQLALLRPDLVWVDLHGTLEDQLSLLDTGAVAGLIASYADLSRLGLAEAATEIFAPELFMPAIGQGGTVVVCRRDDTESCAQVNEACDHFPTRRELVCELQFRRLNPDPCTTACALASDRFLYLFTLRIAPDGKATRLRSSVPVGDARLLAEHATRELAQATGH